MDNNERNEHFKGFAELLYQDLSKLEGSHETLISEYRNKYDKQDIIRLIAQRAYDLVVHCVNNLSSHDFEPYTYELAKEEVTEEDNDIFSHIPDLTEWPKTASE